MNKKITMPELVDILAQKQNCTAREAEIFLKELMSLMTETISSGEVLRINALGVFKPVWVEERSSINVQTGEPYLIPGHYKLTFTPAKSVREAINEPFACFTVEELPDDAPLLSAGAVVDELGDDANDEEPDASLAAETLDEPQERQAVEPDTVAPDNVESQSPESQTESLPDSLPEISAPTPEVETPHSIENVVPEAVDKVVEDVSDDEPVVSHEEAVIDEVVEEAHAPLVPDAPQPVAEDNTENLSKAYHKGVWIGVAATLAILALVVAVLSFCFPHYIASLWGEGGRADLSYADTVLVDEPSGVVIHTLPDTIPTDTVALGNVAETSVKPVVVDTVRRGVFLTNISYKHYGHKAFWVYIYEENSHIISNPDNVPVGTVITIPPAQKYGIDANDTTAVNVALKKADVIKQRVKSQL